MHRVGCVMYHCFPGKLAMDKNVAYLEDLEIILIGEQIRYVGFTDIAM